MKCAPLIVLLCIFNIGLGLDEPPFPGPTARHNAWIHILKKLYDRTEASIGFCFGSDPQKLIHLIGLSFPWPLPVMDPRDGDPICSNRTAISLHLCGPDIIEAYRFMLLTEDPEKVPATTYCPSGGSKIVSACAPGFFAAREGEVVENEENRQWHHHRHHHNQKVAHACCPGYFCPANLVCMIPCPLGAHCPRSTPEPPPKPFRNTHRRGSRGLWCAPYAYRQRPELGCGGADKWTIIPEKNAFPGTPWEAGTGNLYCKPRYYCPNTTVAPVPCPRGKFCRQGSTEPARCPPGAFCPPLTEVPISNFGGVTADALLLCMLGVLWWAASLKRKMLMRLGPRERLKVTWKPYGPRFTVVKADINGAYYSNGVHTSDILPSLPSSPPPPSSQLPSLSSQTRLTTNRNDPLEVFPLEIEFINLSLRLKSCGRLVLANVSAKLNAAKLTAIMGASGAGKSSLLSALAGRAPYGDISGTLYVNGVCTKLELYRRVTGFVPQDDILYAALTVEENLMFSARYRLPAGTNEAERRTHVDNAVVSLGLESVRRDIVGDEAQRGLSGGQRKRVSIGVELVAAPRLLLLDEPTSGLDAAGARALVSTLLAIVARDKVTAAAVVHQPRHEAFLLFDDVLLLGRGGRAAYYGPVDQVEEYFTSLGHRFPEKTNPADALLDILAAEPDAVCDAWAQHDHQLQEHRQEESSEEAAAARRHSSVNEDANADSAIVLGSLHEENSAGLLIRAKESAILAAAFLFKIFISIEDHVSSFFSGVFQSSFRRRPTISQYSRSAAAGYIPLSSSPLPAELLLPPCPGFISQFRWCLSRAATLRSRDPVQTFTDIAIIAATGTTIGLLSDRGRATIMSYASQVSYSVVALGLMATVGSIPTFTQNEAAFRRESASGLHRGAYFAALSFFDFIGSCIHAAAYLATWASFANPKTVLWQMYLLSEEEDPDFTDKPTKKKKYTYRKEVQRSYRERIKNKKAEIEAAVEGTRLELAALAASNKFLQDNQHALELLNLEGAHLSSALSKTQAQYALSSKAALPPHDLFHIADTMLENIFGGRKAADDEFRRYFALPTPILIKTEAKFINKLDSLMSEWMVCYSSRDKIEDRLSTVMETRMKVALQFPLLNPESHLKILNQKSQPVPGTSSGDAAKRMLLSALETLHLEPEQKAAMKDALRDYREGVACLRAEMAMAQLALCVGPGVTGPFPDPERGTLPGLMSTRAKTSLSITESASILKQMPYRMAHLYVQLVAAVPLTAVQQAKLILGCRPYLPDYLQLCEIIASNGT